LAVAPEPTIDRIVGWVTEAVDGEPTPITVPDSLVGVVGRTPDGRAIREQVVWLGPDRLFGIETVPEGPRSADTPPAVFLNAGVIDHVGPGRTWVVLARRLAAHGFRSVRFDLSGLGSTPARTPSVTRATQSIDMLQDLGHAQAAISPENPAAVVLVGLCSGGYHASEAALSTGARGVVMINPSFRLVGSDDRLPAAGKGAEERQVIEAPKRWVRRIPARAFLWRMARRSPDGVWRIVNRVAINHPPAETLIRLARAGTEVLLACDDYDAWFLPRGGHHGLKGYERDGRVRIVAVTGMDHTLFCRQPRALTCDLVVEDLVRRFVPTTDQAAAPAHPITAGRDQGGTSEKDHDLVGR
jgi:alpha-beta hydrolase superfamily lysophospholipase